MGIALIVPDISFAGANLGQVTLPGDVPIAGISIGGPDYVEDSASFLPLFTPAATTQRGVSWSVVSGATYASIDSQSGVLTALQGAYNASVTIRVTSTEDASIFAEKTISVTYIGDVILHNYLLTDGASYFNIGKIGRNDKITIKGKTLSVIPSSANAIFGVAKDSSGANWIYHLYYVSIPPTLGAFAISLGDTHGEYLRNSIDPSSPEFTTIIDIATGNISVGTQSGSATIGEAAFVNGLTPNDAYCFAANKGGAAVSMMGANAFAIAEIIIERGGNIIHDFRPAESAGVYGAYDMVAGQMMPNLGSGAFSVE